jgi:hypothetical protein
MAHLSIRRKKLPQFNKRHYKLLQNKDWVSFSPMGKMTNLRKLSVGSQMPWKQGFLKDSTSYKKCDRYKKSLEEKIEDKVNMLLKNRFMTFI